MNRVWILTAGRMGDLRQMELVAEALGWQTEVISLTFAKASAALLALMPERHLLTPHPWESGRVQPDLVLCAEASTCALAARVKRRGATFKLVCIGRPRGHFGDFDMIITSPQYRLPIADNIVELPVAPHALKAVGDTDGEWLETLKKLPRPLGAILIGGTSRPDMLDGPAAVDLGAAINKMADRKESTVFVVTSPRTGLEATDILRDRLNKNVNFHSWHRGGANPYNALLAVADSFVVTSDSATMVIEAMLTGKPVSLYSLPIRQSSISRALEFFMQFKIAIPLINAGLIERRPDRRLLFQTFERDFSLSSGVAGKTVGELMPQTAETAAALIRTLL